MDRTRAELIALLPRLRRFAFGLTGSTADADDLVQQACLRALANLHRWRPGSRLDSWMYRIVQNLWIDQMRRKSVQGEVTDISPDLPGVDGRETAENRLMLKQVRKLVATLPENQRVVLALVSIEGLSYRQAAEVLKVPIGTVMSRLARARGRLADALDAERPLAEERRT